MEGKSVVELGAGVGLPGIVASKLGAENVCLTDLPTELSLLELNVASTCPATKNDDELSFKRPDIQPLSWGDDHPLGSFDVVLCSDLLYANGETLCNKLISTIVSLSKHGSILLITYQFR